MLQSGWGCTLVGILVEIFILNSNGHSDILIIIHYVILDIILIYRFYIIDFIL